MTVTLLNRLVNQSEPVVWWVPPGEWRLESDLGLAGLMSGSFNPLHTGHLRLCEAAAKQLGGTVACELSMTNAEKPRLTAREIERRCRQFTNQHVAVTTAATFAEKSRLFPGVTFVVGADTAARIVDPRFYRGHAGRMDDALRSVRDHDCSFLVGARSCQLRLLTLDKVPIPPRYERLFREIPPEDFRVDLSSTDIRRGT